MLIKQRIELGSIIAMKLVTGDELIAKVVSHDVGANVLVVAKPIAVGMTQNGSVAFMPYMLGLSEGGDLTFNMDKIVTYVNAREELKNAYIQNTTGIVAAGAGSIPGGLIKA